MKHRIPSPTAAARNSSWLRETETANALTRHLEELTKMGATEEDLHNVFDAAITQLGDRAAASRDPGRGTPEKPVHPMERARHIGEATRSSEAQWLNSLRGRAVLAVGELPPHVLENLLAERISVAQIHQPDHEGYEPPHFRHLARFGLRGFVRFEDLTEEFEVLLIHGAVAGNGVKVSSLVPMILRLFPNAETHVLEAHHQAPHMRMTVSLERTIRVPLMF